MSTVTSNRYTTFRGQITNESGLSIGHKGQEVADLQRMLKAAGFDPGPLDGKFGPLTQRALRAYQNATGERVDGTAELGELTRLRGNFAKITGEGFDEAQAGVNLSGRSPELPVQTTGATGPGTAGLMLERALQQNGDRYVFGAEVRLDDANPDTFDCSELVQWAVAQAGGSIPDGSQNQRRHCQRISVEQAARTPGALLFNGHHVAISVGDGVHTIEAMGSRHGVRIGNIGNRFEDGGLVPGLQY